MTSPTTSTGSGRPAPAAPRAVPELAGVRDVWPRGARLGAVREAAVAFKERFVRQGTATAVRTVALASAPYPARYALGGAARAINPYVSIINRLVLVAYDDFDGVPRILAWEPTAPDGTREAPFYDQLIRRYGAFLSDRVFATYWNDVPGALASCGLAPGDVDLASFDHLHVQDPRLVVGSERMPAGVEQSVASLPDARLLVQRRELATLEDLHPMQWAWYVEGGLDGIARHRLMVIDGDVELGPGVAVVATPGHTDGNQSLVLNTPDGVWVSSENGVAADNWQPELSRIPGVRREARFFRREVVLNANTLEDSLDQYDSMVLEKCLADRSVRDPRWLNILPSSELAPWRRQWPVVPTHYHGEGCADFGAVRAPRPAKDAPASDAG